MKPEDFRAWMLRIYWDSERGGKNWKFLSNYFDTILQKEIQISAVLQKLNPSYK